MEPLVCIILINYNSYDDTVECVRSLEKQKYTNYKIILVDNNSEDRNKLKTDLFLNPLPATRFAKLSSSSRTGHTGC